MQFDVISLFPNFFNSPLKESLLSKAIENHIIEVELHNLRDFATGVHKQVDDQPYGGGAGMVLKPEVLATAVKSIKKQNALVILTDPSGKKFDQRLAVDLAKRENLILIAGRYEGVDQRFKDKYVDLEISIGDYVLNGGEVACLVILETISRLIPGVIGTAESLDFESFSTQDIEGKNKSLLEYPQYTRPAVFEGETVPEELLSGNHAEINKWRLTKALEKTKKLRPDLLDKAEIPK